MPLNGVPGKQFHCKRGVRQRDPLSHLIFVLAADFLQTILNKAMRAGIIQAPIESNSNPDDTILILPASLIQVEQVNNLLKHFANRTRLKINYHKSVMIPINVQEESFNQILNSLGCKRGSFPFT